MIQELEKEFNGIGEVKGYTFQIIAEEKGIGYIYMVTNEVTTHYEVFRHKETPVLIDFEKRIYSETDTKVTYPKSNSFGVWAWTYSNHEQAQVMLNFIINNHIQKELK